MVAYSYIETKMASEDQAEVPNVPAPEDPAKIQSVPAENSAKPQFAPVEDLPKPQSFPSPPVDDPPSQAEAKQEPSDLPRAPPVIEQLADSPKSGHSPAISPPKLPQPRFEIPKSTQPIFVPPELQSSSSAAPLLKQGTAQPSSYSPIQQSFASLAVSPMERSKSEAPLAQESPKQPIAQLQSSVFKPPIFNPPKSAAFSPPKQGMKTGLSAQSPWVSASRPEESKEVPKLTGSKYVFKPGPPPEVPKPEAVSPVSTAQADKPKTLLDEIRESACLRQENPNEWECAVCHLYNSVEFIQCEACLGENKVLDGILAALEKPRQKREKGLMEKSVERAKSWFKW